MASCEFRTTLSVTSRNPGGVSILVYETTDPGGPSETETLIGKYVNSTFFVPDMRNHFILVEHDDGSYGAGEIDTRLKCEICVDPERVLSGATACADVNILAAMTSIVSVGPFPLTLTWGSCPYAPSVCAEQEQNDIDDLNHVFILGSMSGVDSYFAVESFPTTPVCRWYTGYAGGDTADPYPSKTGNPLPWAFNPNVMHSQTRMRITVSKSGSDYAVILYIDIAGIMKEINYQKTLTLAQLSADSFTLDLAGVTTIPGTVTYSLPSTVDVRKVTV